MENKEIKFTVQLTEKDYFNYQFDHTPFLRSKKIITYCVILLIIIGWVFIPTILENGFSNFPIESLIPIVILISSFLFIFFAAKSRTKHAFKSDPTVNHPYDIVITDHEVIIHAYKSSLTSAWEDIYRYNKTKNAIYIYTSDLKSIIIPIRYFENETHIEYLHNLLKQKVNFSRFNSQSSRRKNTLYEITSCLVMMKRIFNFQK